MFWTKLINILYISLTLLTENKKTQEMEKYNRLKNWAIENGAEFGSFQIKYLSYSNRFVVASDTIKKGEIIMKIPYKLILTPDKSQIKLECAKYNFTEVDCYPLYLSLEKQNNQSFYKPYLDYLPTEFDYFPSFFNNELIQYLNGSIIIDYYEQFEKYFQKNYEKIKSDYNLTYDEFKKANFLYYSRNFDSSKENQEKTIIVPMADLLNFNPIKLNTYWYYNHTCEYFIFVAKKDIKKGEEIFSNYGKNNNLYFHFFYGFVFPYNENSIKYDFSFRNNTIRLRDNLELKKIMPYLRKEYSENIISIEDELESLDILQEFIEKNLLKIDSKIQKIFTKFNSSKKFDDYMLFCVHTLLTEEKELLEDYNKLILEIIQTLELSDNLEIINNLLGLRKKRVSVRYIKQLIFYVNNS